ncbi:MAG: hypothetical protein H7X88_06715, partial [Gloeobacteraceae cyanobacterium ES-bin-316]|nr:hypothetical protein [Ferruginibacter sp.]
MVIAAWLITLSFLINNYWSSYSTLQSVQKTMNSYVQDAEADFRTVLSDPGFDAVQKGKPFTDEQQQMLTGRNYFIFFYKKNSAAAFNLQYWNTQQVLPDAGITGSSLKVGFAELANGFYVWNKSESAGVLAIALIPVKWNYIVTNAYLKNNFVHNPRTGLQYDIFPGEGLKGSVTSLYGAPLFYLVEKKEAIIERDNVVSLWLRVIAVLLVLLFIHLCAVYIAGKNLAKGILFLAGSLFILRLLSYVFPFPLNLRQLELFDPTIYASGFILRSLGDLLINAILFVWIVMFVRQQMLERNVVFHLKNKYARWGLLITGCLIMLCASFIGVHIIRSLISDSHISFDVINFFSLNVYSVIGFLILCCLAVGFYFLCQLVLFLIKPFFSAAFPELYLCAAILGLLFLSINFGVLQQGMQLYSLAWLLLCLFLFNNNYLNQVASRIVSSKLIFWIFFFSLSMTFLIIVENNNKELRNRYHYAEVLATKTDPASESMLNSMLTDFRLDFLSGNFNRLKNELSNRFLKDSLINNNFSGYTNRYDTRIYSYDENENALFNDDNADYNQLNTILNTQAKPTAVADLYYYDESYDRFNYISKKVIKDFSGNFLGT